MTQLASLVAALALFATPPLPSQVRPTAPPSSDTCIASVRDVSHSSYSARNDKHEVEWRSDGCDVTISFDGDPRFTEDFRTLQSLGPGGYFDIDETEPAPETRARDSAAGRRARIPVLDQRTATRLRRRGPPVARRRHQGVLSTDRLRFEGSGRLAVSKWRRGSSARTRSIRCRRPIRSRPTCPP